MILAARAAAARARVWPRCFQPPSHISAAGNLRLVLGGGRRVRRRGLQELCRPDTIAGSDLESFEGGKVVLRLDRPADVALWREPGGALRGVFQGAGAIPEPLLRITTDWTCLSPGHGASPCSERGRDCQPR